MNWDKRFMQMAALVAGWSKDPSTKCGAVIVDSDRRVVSVGFNGFPKGTSDALDRYADREEKYLRVVHAEKNAILFARRDLVGCTLYVTPMPPCSQCAGMIIQVGIKRVVTLAPTEEQRSRWGRDITVTYKMFDEVFIEMSTISTEGII